MFGPLGTSCSSRALAALCRCPLPCCSCSLEIWPPVWADVRPRFSKKARLYEDMCGRKACIAAAVSCGAW